MTNKDKKDMHQNIKETSNELREFLLAKNQQYGNSVANPIRVFAKEHGTQELLRIRMDDKLSRLARGNDSMESDEDVIKDLAGYCILLLIAMREEL
tara:strand:+ start:297 stop:584 length:288 start_codon:yes stop_codon:yes gene_type:complete